MSSVDDLVKNEWREGISPGAAARQLCRTLDKDGSGRTLCDLLEELLADANTENHRKNMLERAARIMLSATGITEALPGEDQRSIPVAQVEAVRLVRQNGRASATMDRLGVPTDALVRQNADRRAWTAEMSAHLAELGPDWTPEKASKNAADLCHEEERRMGGVDNMREPAVVLDEARQDWN